MSEYLPDFVEAVTGRKAKVREGMCHVNPAAAMLVRSLAEWGYSATGVVLRHHATWPSMQMTQITKLVAADTLSMS